MRTLPTLVTERLRLRPFRRADAAAVQRLAGERAIADTTLAIPHPYPVGAAERWIASQAPGYRARTQATFAITTRADGALVGAIGLMLEMGHARGELGYWVGVPYWNRGYATEAGRAVLAFGFGALGLHRIQARHLIRNPASGRVMEKLRMRLEGVHRGAIRKGGRFEDLAMRAILAPEWARRRAATASNARGPAAHGPRGRRGSRGPVSGP